LMVSLLTLRTIFMNCSASTISAIMINHVNESDRGKWASMEIVTTAGWCGSAVIGGWICDQYGYGMSFIITMILQSIGTLILTPILLKEK
jgi:MFS family permease